VLARLSICVVFVLLPVFAQNDLNILSGRFTPDKTPSFKAVPAKYTSGNTQYLDADALAAFLKMAKLAESKGYAIKIVSGTRNFNTQKAIWEQKFSGARKVGGKNLAESVKDEEKRALEILRYSSMPGTSRHHWGTDLDLHETKLAGPALHNSTFKSGRGKDFHTWLTQNAPQFGFCQPYTGDPASRNGGKFRHGYQEESWHWSYKPISAEYLRAYQNQAAAMRPKGYAGDKAAAHFYMDYVQNIDPSCL
jgi:D-alanyl-D-alanine carboxypeptidase